MSNPRVVAAVTGALRARLQQAIRANADAGDATVSLLPLDQALKSDNKAALNLYLYEAAISGTWRSPPTPRSVDPPATTLPPLGLNLHYMLSSLAPAQPGTFPIEHQHLASAMLALHEEPILGFDRIRNAAGAIDVGTQIEHVRITPLPLSIEEMSKLWSSFQASYRVSVAYEVAVVLIDGKGPTAAPPPVLSRGGIDTQLDKEPVFAALLPPFPTIDEVEITSSRFGTQSTARIGDTIIVSGYGFEGSDHRIHLRRIGGKPTEEDDIKPAAAGDAATTFEVQLPDKPVLAAGWWGLSVRFKVKSDDPVWRESNEVPVAIGPEITAIARQTRMPVASRLHDFTIDVRPKVRLGQRASLLVGDSEVPASAFTGDVAQLKFEKVGPLATGRYLLRLRVDGVESAFILHRTYPRRRTDPPMEFDDAQKVDVP